MDDARSHKGDIRKASSVAVNKVGLRCRHETRSAQRGRYAGRRENLAGEFSRLRGDDGSREASGVAHNSFGVGDEEGGREASVATENSLGSCQGVEGGVDSPQGTDAPGGA